MSILKTTKEEAAKLLDSLKKLRLSIENGDPIEEEITMAEAVLKDGTIVRYEGELAEGVAIMVVTPEGEMSAPDGEHELEDGTIISTSEGKVTAITPAEPSVEVDAKKQIEAAKAAFAKVEFAEGDPKDLMLKALMEYCFGWEMREESRKAAIDAAITAYKTGSVAMSKDALEESNKKIAALEKANEAQKSQISQLVKFCQQNIELVQQLADMPAAQPSPTPQPIAKLSKHEELMEKAKKQAAFIKSLNN